jgi:hypothetical protein
MISDTIWYAITYFMRSGSDFYFRKVTQIETYLLVVECVQKKWCLKSRSRCVVVMETKAGKEHSTPDHVLEESIIIIVSLGCLKFL